MRDVFSLLLRVVNTCIHILVIYTCKFVLYCFIFYGNEALILVKILLDATFSGIPLTESFLRLHEQIHIGKIYTKIICIIFSGRFDVHLQGI